MVCVCAKHLILIFTQQKQYLLSQHDEQRMRKMNKPLKEGKRKESATFTNEVCRGANFTACHNASARTDWTWLWASDSLVLSARTSGVWVRVSTELAT